ncbi:two-component system sensor histidine kinase YesM [Hydrogenispora ethanolica]|uniref:histidine kinase n=1 Tax=Hydrogenispora ethanolica TaxID=1082276 RepID=A0A4R1RUJ8_HYDET|nr:sensor histidine kinase [Hydrogenispora ethanolica]TCL70079.1 two-component system sensor histidine kinase YesM [Hydrogenispora ethanolica]
MNRRLTNLPIKTKLLLGFLPVIILAVFLTGLCSYLSAVRQLRENAYYLLQDTILQTNGIINDKLTTAFGQLYAIENDRAFKNALQLSAERPGTDADSYRRIVNYINLNKTFNDIYLNYFQMIDSIYARLNDGSEFQLQRESIPKRTGIAIDEWLQKYQGSPTGYYWLNRHRDTVFDTVSPRQVMSVFKLIGRSDSRVNGIVLLNLKSAYFYQLLANIKVSPNGYLALISPDGILFSRKAKEEYGIGRPEIALIRKRAGGEGSFTIRSVKKRKMLVFFNTLPVNQWLIAAIVPERDILEKAGQIKYISLLIILLLILISTVVATFLAGSMSNSISYLSRQVRKVQNGDLEVRFDIKDSNEIGVLAKGLSELLGSVKNLLRQVREEQEQKRKMELLALQSQINPHFLYNTLASIKHLIDLNENQKASTMVNAITRFFMIGISKGKELILLREELEHVHHYLTIQKIRYSKGLDFQFAVSETILNSPIIKLTLQPIVENSIYHGIKNKIDPGLIRITGYQGADDIVIEISDDGVGIEPERLRQLTESLEVPELAAEPITFGLRNVNQRLKLHFGREYGLQITSVVGEGTKVTVRLPFAGGCPDSGKHVESIDRG